MDGEIRVYHLNLVVSIEGINVSRVNKGIYRREYKIMNVRYSQEDQRFCLRFFLTLRGSASTSALHYLANSIAIIHLLHLYDKTYK
jgi:hypothetical protein